MGRVGFSATPGLGLTRRAVRRMPALGACRLGLGREELQPDGSVHTDLVCGPENEGGPDVAHGGWTAGVFDELLGHVPLLNGVLAVTGQLSVTYVKPVPVGRPLHARASTVRREGHRWYVAGELTLASTRAVLARGEAVMVVRDIGHFARHQEWLARHTRQCRASRGPAGVKSGARPRPAARRAWSAARPQTVPGGPRLACRLAGRRCRRRPYSGNRPADAAAAGHRPAGRRRRRHPPSRAHPARRRPVARLALS